MPIHEKLLAVQSALKAPKGQQNTFGKYKYRSCEDIFEAVKPLLKEQGLILTLTDDIVTLGTRFYVRAYAELSDGTDRVAVAALAREEEEKKGMDGSQITGAASSYARKYALNGLFLIDDTKDSDHTNTHDKKKATEPDPLPSLKMEVWNLCGKNLDKVNEAITAAKVHDLNNVANAKRVLAYLVDRTA